MTLYTRRRQNKEANYITQYKTSMESFNDEYLCPIMLTILLLLLHSANINVIIKYTRYNIVYLHTEQSQKYFLLVVNRFP